MYGGMTRQRKPCFREGRLWALSLSLIRLLLAYELRAPLCSLRCFRRQSEYRRIPLGFPPCELGRIFPGDLSENRAASERRPGRVVIVKEPARDLTGGI